VETHLKVLFWALLVVELVLGLLALVRVRRQELPVERPQVQLLELPQVRRLEQLLLRLLKPPLVFQVHSQPLQEQWVECLMGT
jgi:hypothetical protein